MNLTTNEVTKIKSHTIDLTDWKINDSEKWWKLIKVNITDITQNKLVEKILSEITSIYTDNTENIDDFYFNICKNLQAKYLT